MNQRRPEAQHVLKLSTVDATVYGFCRCWIYVHGRMTGESVKRIAMVMPLGCTSPVRDSLDSIVRAGLLCKTVKNGMTIYDLPQKEMM